MGKILQFEADRRALNITINSFGTELAAQKEERAKLYVSPLSFTHIISTQQYPSRHLPLNVIVAQSSLSVGVLGEP
jgi:hypothetical protein